MVARGKSLPNLCEIENKMNELRSLLGEKEPKMSSDEIEELVLYLINQNFI